MSPAAAFQAYSNIIDDQFQSYYSSTSGTGAPRSRPIAVGATDSAYALEMVSREATLVAGALAVDRGQLDAGARQLFISSAANRQFLMSQTLSLLTPSLRGGTSPSSTRRRTSSSRPWKARSRPAPAAGRSR